MALLVIYCVIVLVMIEFVTENTKDAEIRGITRDFCVIVLVKIEFVTENTKWCVMNW